MNEMGMGGPVVFIPQHQSSFNPRNANTPDEVEIAIRVVNMIQHNVLCPVHQSTGMDMSEVSQFRTLSLSEEVTYNTALRVIDEFFKGSKTLKGEK